MEQTADMRFWRPLSALNAVWQHRELLEGLILRNLKVKYQRSALGFLWTLANPLFTVLVLVAVFTYIVRIPIPHYWAFLISGYFVWNFTLQALTTATIVIAEHSRLSHSVAFPGEILLFSAIGSRFVELLIELSLVVLTLVIFHHAAVPASLALLPLILLIQLLLTLGLAFPIATVSVFYTDIKHALPIALTTLFYITPVFYSVDLVPDSLRSVIYLNPLTGILTLYHDVLYYGQTPSLLSISVMLFVSLLFCLFGYAIFNRHKSVFTEVV